MRYAVIQLSARLPPPRPLAGDTLTFAEVGECVRLANATAIGIVRARGAACELAPAMGTSVTLHEGDAILVIAED